MTGAPRAPKLKSALLPPPSELLLRPREQGAKGSRRPPLSAHAGNTDMRPWQLRPIGAGLRRPGPFRADAGWGLGRAKPMGKQSAGSEDGAPSQSEGGTQLRGRWEWGAGRETESAGEEGLG